MPPHKPQAAPIDHLPPPAHEHRDTMVGTCGDPISARLLSSYALLRPLVRRGCDWARNSKLSDPRRPFRAGCIRQHPARRPHATRAGPLRLEDLNATRRRLYLCALRLIWRVPAALPHQRFIRLHCPSYLLEWPKSSSLPLRAYGFCCAPRPTYPVFPRCGRTVQSSDRPLPESYRQYHCHMLTSA